jgi:hypothetical protein
MLPEHKPVRRGREMIDLLVVEEPKPKPAKITGGVVRGSDLFKRMRSSSSALTQQAVSTPRGPGLGIPNFSSVIRSRSASLISHGTRGKYLLS